MLLKFILARFIFTNNIINDIIIGIRVVSSLNSIFIFIQDMIWSPWSIFQLCFLWSIVHQPLHLQVCLLKTCLYFNLMVWFFKCNFYSNIFSPISCKSIYFMKTFLIDFQTCLHRFYIRKFCQDLAQVHQACAYIIFYNPCCQVWFLIFHPLLSNFLGHFFIFFINVLKMFNCIYKVL